MATNENNRPVRPLRIPVPADTTTPPVMVRHNHPQAGEQLAIISDALEDIAYQDERGRGQPARASVIEELKHHALTLIKEFGQGEWPSQPTTEAGLLTRLDELNRQLFDLETERYHLMRERNKIKIALQPYQVGRPPLCWYCDRPEDDHATNCAPAQQAAAVAEQIAKQVYDGEPS